MQQGTRDWECKTRVRKEREKGRKVRERKGKAGRTKERRRRGRNARSQCDSISLTSPCLVVVHTLCAGISPVQYTHSYCGERRVMMAKFASLGSLVNTFTNG